MLTIEDDLRNMVEDNLTISQMSVIYGDQQMD